MRLTVWLLFAANVLVLAWGAFEHYLGGPPNLPHTPEIAPDRIKLLSADEAHERRARRQIVACAEWGPFVPADADRAERYIASTGMVVKSVERRIEPGAAWWVFIPSAANRQAAEARLQQIRQRGVSDATIVLDDPRHLNSISFGAFMNEATAQRRRDDLNRLGVTDAVAAPRETLTTRVFVRLLEAPRALIDQIGGIKDDFLGSDVTACPRTP